MHTDTQWTKSGIGLYRYNPNGQYHARVRVGGRLYRRALGTGDYQLARRKLSDFKRDLGRTDARAGNVSGDHSHLPANTKLAKLITMLERPEGASVAEIGQRLGWLPHTVRAAVTGLRRAGRAVTRSKDADDRSVYRLAPVETSDKR